MRWARSPTAPTCSPIGEADRLKVLVYDGAGMWLCTRRLQAGSFEWPRQASGSIHLSREQFDWLVAGLPWQRLSAPQPTAITAV